jgi:hypothetical protein
MASKARERTAKASRKQAKNRVPRGFQGQFVPGVCPNPRDRPKRGESLAEVFVSDLTRSPEEPRSTAESWTGFSTSPLRREALPLAWRRRSSRSIGATAWRRRPST